MLYLKKRFPEMNFYLKYIPTPIGRLYAVADEEGLLMLDFEDSKYAEKNINSFRNCIHESNSILDLAEKELNLYFKGKLKKFSVPVRFSGTEFQQKVWEELLKIPFGETISYQEQAQRLSNPKAVRAVANANSRNKISIIIPCHRVIGKDKKLTGYAGGLDKKEFLLNLENTFYKD